jgi:hypothetical protein
VLLISFRESADLVRRTVAERGYTAPVLLDASGDVTGKLYGVWGPPTAYLVDREGRLVGRMVGAKDWSSASARDLIRSLVTVPR